MTPVALFQLSGRIGLFLFGLGSIWCGIWYVVYDYLPQSEPSRSLMPESLRSRHWVLTVCTCLALA